MTRFVCSFEVGWFVVVFLDFFIIGLFVCLLKAGAEKLGERDLSDGLPFYGTSHLPLVQFRSRWPLCPRKSPYLCTPPRLSDVFLKVAFFLVFLLSTFS